MYFNERLIGVITYSILLIIFAILIKNTEKSPKKILRIYVIILSILAFFYIPNPGYDLERIYITLNKFYRPMSSYQFLEFLKNSYTPSINIFYYIISKTNYLGIVPASAAFIFYSSIFSIFSGICERYNISGYKRFIFLIFIMSLGTYLEVISNIRCMTAFSIIIYCYFNEIFNKKSIIKHLPLYLISSTMHLAALAIIIIRFVIYPLQKKKGKIFYAMLPISVILIIYIFYPNYINQIFFTESYYKEIVNYSYLPEYILMSIMTIYILFIKIIHWRSIISDENLKQINIFSIIILLIMIINILEYSMFHRMGTLHFLINIPIMGKYISLLTKKDGLIFILLISVVILIVASLFGNLCGFKYFIFR